MSSKGSKQEWIDYFTSINGRPPSASEIEAARDIYEDGEAAFGNSSVGDLQSSATASDFEASGDAANQSSANQTSMGDGYAGAAEPVQSEGFITTNQSHASAGWRALVQSESKLATTMAVVTGLLGILWVVIVVNISSVLGNIHQLVTQVTMLLQDNRVYGPSDYAQLQTLISAVTSVLSAGRMFAIILAVVMIILAANYLFRIIKLKKPLYWLIGADAVGAVAAIGGFMTLHNTLNIMVVPAQQYTVGDILDMGGSLITGATQSIANSAVGDVSIRPFLQQFARYVTDIGTSIHTTYNVLTALSIIATVVVVIGIYLAVKGPWRTGEAR